MTDLFKKMNISLITGFIPVLYSGLGFIFVIIILLKSDFDPHFLPDCYFMGILSAVILAVRHHFMTVEITYLKGHQFAINVAYIAGIMFQLVVLFFGWYITDILPDMKTRLLIFVTSWALFGYGHLLTIPRVCSLSRKVDSYASA